MVGRVPLFDRNSLPVRPAGNAVSQPFRFRVAFARVAARADRRASRSDDFSFRKYQSVSLLFFSLRKVAHAEANGE
jgi:hypothetical protein